MSCYKCKYPLVYYRGHYFHDPLCHCWDGYRYFIPLHWEEVEDYKKLLGGKLGCVWDGGRGWLPPMRDDQQPSPIRSQLFPMPTDALCSFCFWPNLLFSGVGFQNLANDHLFQWCCTRELGNRLPRTPTSRWRINIWHLTLSPFDRWLSCEMSTEQIGVIRDETMA